MYEVILSDSYCDLEFNFHDSEMYDTIPSFIMNALKHRKECMVSICYYEEREDTCLNNMKSDT